MLSTLRRQAPRGLVLLALLCGACGLVQINGKPVSFPSGASSNEERSNQESATDSSSASTADAKPARARTGAHGLPAELCRRAEGNGGTFAALDDALERKALEYAVQYLVGALCATSGEVSEDPARTLRVAKAWMDSQGLDERDLAVLYDVATGRGDSAQRPETFAGPVGQFGQIAGYATDRMLALDRLGPGASMLAKVALVRACYNLGIGDYDPAAEHSLLLSIVCSREPIDLAQVQKELDGTAKLTEATRYSLRRWSWRAHVAVREERARLTALAKEDPAVRRLIAIADREFAAWAKPDARRVRLRDRLQSLEAAAESNKRSAFKGCEEATLAAWTQTLEKKVLPAVPDKHQLAAYSSAALDDAEGFLAFAALQLCARAEEPAHEGGLIEEISSGQVRRGPRTGTVASWLADPEPFEFDDKALRFDSLAGKVLGAWGAGPSQDTPRQGLIAQLSEEQGQVRVTFKTVREPRMACLRWVKTRRILRIDEHGQLIYEERCAGSGKIMMDLTAPPVRLPKLLAQGLRPGMFLVAVEGLPIVATRSASSDTPIFVLGGLLR